MKHINITVSGKVQGVFYRASAKAVADQIGVKGIVYNKKDGTVFIEAESSPQLLDAFCDWCREGPDDANVESIDITSGELKNYRNFEVVKYK